MPSKPVHIQSQNVPRHRHRHTRTRGIGLGREKRNELATSIGNSQCWKSKSLINYAVLKSFRLHLTALKKESRVKISTWSSCARCVHRSSSWSVFNFREKWLKLIGPIFSFRESSLTSIDKQYHFA